jgi:hypothetical protein
LSGSQIDGHVIQFAFCSDLKFINLVFGIGACSIDQSCPFCLCTRDDRMGLKHFTINNNRFDSLPSLFPYIKPKDVRVDILHLLLRVMDVLMFQLFTEAARLLGDAVMQRNVIEEMARLGITFQFWQSAAKSELAWTTLDGKSKLHVLLNLVCENVFKVRNEDRRGRGKKNIAEVETIGERVVWSQQRWLDFAEIYGMMDSWAPQDSTLFRTRVDKWLRALTADGCYSRTIITPYLHILHSHVADFLNSEVSLKAVACQNQEYQNSVHKRAFFDTQSRRGHQELAGVLRVHLRTIFNPFAVCCSPPRSLQCTECPKKYTYRKSFEKHQIKRHSK